MSSLSIGFCGIEMDNPVVIAASPATETVEGIIECSRAGAGAIITKSIADYNESAHQMGARRAYLNSRGFWATSTFRRETLSRSEGMGLIADAARQTSVPIIASITGTDLEVNHWLPTCLGAVNAGACAIQLDLFYLPQPICSAHSMEGLVDLLGTLAAEISVPVVPKLNIEIPAYLAAQLFPQSGIAGFSLLDSVRVPSPIDVDQRGASRYRFVQKPGMSSLFGEWQLPLAQHYTLILGRLTDLPLCAGGGLTSARDALELIMLGATTVQYATAVLVKGYEYVRKLVGDLDNLLIALGYDTILDVQGISLKEQRTDAEGATPLFETAKVAIDYTRCTKCGRCLDLAFCNAIAHQGDFIRITQSLCDGCGFCTYFCGAEALSLERVPKQTQATRLTI